MEPELTAMHIRAGRAYGRDATCGSEARPKVRYGSEEAADKAAAKMSVVYGKFMEGYPCAWCQDWHIGRAMTPEEVRMFLTTEGDERNG